MMTELFQAAFSGFNIVYTILLILVLLYWCIVMLGIIDLDGFDMDLDVDVDVDPGMEGTTEGAFSWLGFFNVGEVPIMFFASIVILVMWVVSIQINYWLDLYTTGWIHDYRGWIAGAMVIPNLLFGMLFAKCLLIPVKRWRHRPPQQTKLEGKVCNVTSLEVTEEFGRCETPKSEGSLILDVRTCDGEVLRKGDAAEILEQVTDGDHRYYIVTKKVWDG